MRLKLLKDKIKPMTKKKKTKMKKEISKPNRENFLKLADKLFSDVIVNKIISAETAGRMLEDYFIEVDKSRQLKECKIHDLEIFLDRKSPTGIIKKCKNCSHIIV